MLEREELIGKLAARAAAAEWRAQDLINISGGAQAAALQQQLADELREAIRLLSQSPADQK